MIVAATMPDYAGLVQYRRARSTGTHVGIYNNAQAGIGEGDPNPWSTVCEEHGGIVTHPTLELARAHAPRPDDWCPTCQGFNQPG